MKKLLSALTLVLATNSIAYGESLPVVNLKCTDGTSIVFQETNSPEGLGVLGNQIEFAGSKIEIELLNTNSGLRSIRGEVGLTKFLLEELRDAPHWSLNQTTNGIRESATCFHE